MTSSHPAAHALIALITPVYEALRDLETPLLLTVGKGDVRVRVEYFHDAVRAFTAGETRGDTTGRLSVEQLAYDLSAIRYLQQKPLAALHPKHVHASPGSALVTRSSKALVGGYARTATRDDKQRLADFYLRYGLLFAALFKPVTDRDARDRVEEIDAQVSALLQAKNGKDRAKALDKVRKTVETAQMDFSTAQLGLYEEGKDMVKALAADGLNLAGQFVASATARDTQRGRGR